MNKYGYPLLPFYLSLQVQPFLSNDKRRAPRSDYIFNKKLSKGTVVYFLSTRHGLHRIRRTQQFFCLCVCIRCNENVFTKPIPNNNRGMHLQTDRQNNGRHFWSTPWYRPPGFLKTSAGSQNLIRGKHRHIDRMQIIFFQNKESKVKALLMSFCIRTYV